MNDTPTKSATSQICKTLSAILNGKAGISPMMAIKLSIAFDSTPESWLELQNGYDLWKEQQLLKAPLNIHKFFQPTGQFF